MKFLTQFRRSAGMLFFQTMLASGILLLSFSPSSLFAHLHCSGWNEEGYFHYVSIAELTGCVLSGANLEDRNSKGLTPLHSVLDLYVLLDRGDDFVHNAVSILLHAGADPNAVDTDGETVLNTAVLYTYGDAIVTMLLEHDADPDTPHPDGWSPLHLTVSRDDQVKAQALLEFGADPNAVDADGETVLHYAVSETTEEAMTRMLLEYGADPDALHPDGFRPLHLAVARDDQAKAEALVEFGADPNTVAENGQSVLYVALSTTTGDAIIRMLLEHGADPQTHDPDGFSLLHLAVARDDPAKAKVLIEFGEDPNGVDASGVVTVLLYAVSNTTGDAMIRMLLEHGADPEMPNSEGNIPLQIALDKRDPAKIVALIEFGANPNIAVEDGTSPIGVVALRSEDPTDLESLLSAGAKLQLDSWIGALTLAIVIAENRNPEIGSMLLQEYHEAVAGEQSVFWKPGLRQVKCWFEEHEVAGDVECFYMVVDENPLEPSNQYVSFPVVRFFDRNLSTRKSPVLYLGAGGPGSGTGIKFPSSYQTQWDVLAKSTGRDLYVVDVRGTGIAHPKLSCDLHAFRRTFEDAEYLEYTRPFDALLSDYQSCRTRLDELGIDLSQYNSSVVVHDVELLRRELGIEKWVPVGYSYSARYAVTVARDFPNSVESMVLVVPGGLPGSHITPENLPEDNHKAFEKVFTWCTKEMSSCNSDDDLGERFQILVERLNKDPLTIASSSEMLYFNYQFTIDRVIMTGQRLVDWVLVNIYDTEFFDDFPNIVSELEGLVDGSEEQISENLLNSIVTYLDWYFSSSFSDPVYYAHLCSEERPFLEYSEWTRTGVGTPEYIRLYYEDYYTERDFVRECQIWDVALSAEKENEYVKTDIPALFLIGALDPVVSIDHLSDQLPYFSNREMIIFENSSHWGPVYEDCAKDAAAFFITNKHLEDRHFECGKDFN